MDFTVGVPTLNRADTLFSFIVSVLESSVLPKELIVVDNSGGKVTQAICDHTIPEHVLKAASKVHLSFHVADENLGVAGSWNFLLGIHTSIPMIISNDDLILDIFALENLLKANTNADLVCGASDSGNAFSLFLLPQKLYNDVGPFDTEFYPAYFEDNDYAYRMICKGYTIREISCVRYTHEGSATLKAYTSEQTAQHHIDFEKNRSRYIAKWGGLPGFETYRKPWNNETS